jgi:hypothetical protein
VCNGIPPGTKLCFSMRCAIKFVSTSSVWSACSASDRDPPNVDHLIAVLREPVEAQVRRWMEITGGDVVAPAAFVPPCIQVRRVNKRKLSTGTCVGMRFHSHVRTVVCCAVDWCAWYGWVQLLCEVLTVAAVAKDTWGTGGSGVASDRVQVSPSREVHPLLFVSGGLGVPLRHGIG